MRTLLLILFMVHAAAGATYFVANGGSDAAAGTSTGTAWQTVAKVNAQTFSAGDTISFNRGDTWDERLTVPSTGTAGNYITFTAYGSGALPVLLATNGRPEAVSIGVGKAYIKVTHLHFRGGDTGSASALLESESTENLIEDCKFEGQNLADSCIGGSSTARRCWIQGARDDGYTLHGTNQGLVENCVFTNNRSAINLSGTSMILTVNDSVFEDNGDGSGFGDINGLTTCTFIANRCLLNGRADGGPIGYYTTGGSGEDATFNYCLFNNSRSSSATFGSINVGTGSALKLNNCLFIGAASVDRGAVTANTGTLNATNCIFFNVWRLKATDPGVLNLRHCIVFNTGGIDVPGEHVYTANTDGSTADPLFVDAPGGNFRLLTGSPAINAGANLGLLTDLAGATVYNPPEVGAYEFSAAKVTLRGNLVLRGNVILRAP